MAGYPCRCGKVADTRVVPDEVLGACSNSLSQAELQRASGYHSLELENFILYRRCATNLPADWRRAAVSDQYQGYTCWGCLQLPGTLEQCRHFLL